MHVEIQVALNFFISFLYNKLPRRRVNQFGEELDKALKRKFQGHWYPEKPFKGSAFRCLKTAMPLDPVFGIAAHESGMAMEDLQRNLPEELSIWIDPGEVSYRLGEKCCVKILYSEFENSEDRADREIYRTFNPEAQCFKPIDSVASQLGSIALSSTTGSSTSSSPFNNSPSPTYKSSSSPINGFLPKATNPLTFTTATFAQTKFGSTKLKSNGKRSQRMSPTEFSSYIKQRAIIQQQQQQTQIPQMFAPISSSQQRPRSLSPSPPSSVSPQQSSQLDANSFLLLASLQQQQQSPFSPTSLLSPNNQRQSFYDGGFLNDIFSTASSTNGNQSSGLLTPNSNLTKPAPTGSRLDQALSNANALSLFLDKGPFSSAASPVNEMAGSSSFKSNMVDNGNKGYGGNIDNFNVCGMSYPNQHLLMAN